MLGRSRLRSTSCWPRWPSTAVPIDAPAKSRQDGRYRSEASARTSCSSKATVRLSGLSRARRRLQDADQGRRGPAATPRSPSCSSTTRPWGAASASSRSWCTSPRRSELVAELGPIPGVPDDVPPGPRAGSRRQRSAPDVDYMASAGCGCQTSPSFLDPDDEETGGPRRRLLTLRAWGASAQRAPSRGVDYVMARSPMRIVRRSVRRGLRR